MYLCLFLYKIKKYQVYGNGKLKVVLKKAKLKVILKKY